MNNNGYSRNFKLLVAGENINNISTNMMLVLFPWIVLSITYSPLLTGLEFSLSGLPLSMSFIVGYYLTRLKNKKSLYVWTTVMRSLILLFIFLVFLTGNKLYELISIFAGYFLTSWSEDVTGQIGAYFLKGALDEDQYQKGFSLSGFLRMIILLISYIIAGYFIAIGTEYAFPVLILGFAISAVVNSLIKPVSESEEEETHHSFKDGVSYIWNNKILRNMTAQNLFFSLSVGGFLMMIEVLIKFVYNGSPLELTVLLVASMLGGVVGSKFAYKVGGNPRKVMGFLAFALIPMMIFIPFSPLYIYIVADGFIIMFASQIYGVIYSTVFYKAVPKDYILQAHSVHSSLTLFPAVFSSLILGAIIQFISLEWAFVVSGILLVPSIYFIWNSRQLDSYPLG